MISSYVEAKILVNGDDAYLYQMMQKFFLKIVRYFIQYMLKENSSDSWLNY